MITYYEQKKEFHHKQWSIAQDAGKTKAAEFHMQEYLNYSEMANQVK